MKPIKSNNELKCSCPPGENYVVISTEEMNTIYRALEDITKLLSLQAAHLDPETYDDLIASLKTMSEFTIMEKESI